MIPRKRVREALGTTAAKNAPRTLESMLAMNDRAIKMVMAPERLGAKASSPVKICAGTVQSEHSVSQSFGLQISLEIRDADYVFLPLYPTDSIERSASQKEEDEKNESSRLSQLFLRYFQRRVARRAR